MRCWIFNRRGVGVAVGDSAERGWRRAVTFAPRGRAVADALHLAASRHPGELSGGRPWLLQLCTRGPIEAEFPVAERPMRVVYWARWVGMKGDMGPFSQTCVGEFEGQRLPNKVLLNHSLARRRAQRVTITTVRPELPGPVESIEALTCDAQRLLREEAA
jgi:hypothetical protein